MSSEDCLAFYLEDPDTSLGLNATRLILTPVQRAFCDGCFDIVDKEFELYREIIVERVKSMQTLDWMVFLLNSLVLCLSVANELFDIQYCRAIAEGFPDRYLYRHVALWIVEALRMYLFIPLTLAMPVAMVYTLGGSALQTTLNTLAVVFLPVWKSKRRHPAWKSASRLGSTQVLARDR